MQSNSKLEQGFIVKVNRLMCCCWRCCCLQYFLYLFGTGRAFRDIGKINEGIIS